MEDLDGMIDVFINVSSLNHQGPPIRLLEPETCISDPQFSRKYLYCVLDQISKNLGLHKLAVILASKRKISSKFPGSWTKHNCKFLPSKRNEVNGVINYLSDSSSVTASAVPLTVTDSEKDLLKGNKQ